MTFKPESSFVTISTHCDSCGGESEVLGVFSTEAEAKAARTELRCSTYVVLEVAARTFVSANIVFDGAADE